jgi:hypothetical protein
VTARLLTDRAVADYLSLPLTCARKVMAGRVMLEGKIRWDRVALDAWLDALRGSAPHAPANANMTGPDAALAQFLAGSQDAARRS